MAEHVCSEKHSWFLDNFFRRLIHPPKKILSKHITKGMTALDFGCGPGVFTTELADLVGNKGRVIAVDLQKEMLNKLDKKIKNTLLQKRIKTIQCKEKSIECNKYKNKVDFILLFYCVHEVPSPQKLFKELKALLKPNAKILMIEPKFHVTKKKFNDSLKIAEKIGFKTNPGPKVFFSRSRILSL